MGRNIVIFASVGSLLPFDRLVRAVDEWAAANVQTPVFIQIGNSGFEPQHAEWARIIDHEDYARRLAQCDLFVAHVGMGSILQALEARKQMLLMPRHAALREHTTDHQLDTAARFGDVAGLAIVDDETRLKSEMSRLLANPMTPSEGISPFADVGFTSQIARFLSNNFPLSGSLS